MPDKKIKLDEFGEQDSGESDSLRLYYRQLNDSAPLSAEDELALWQELDRNKQAIRDTLYQFGFILPEHIKLFQRTAHENLGDVFYVSEGEKGQTAYESFHASLIVPWIGEVKDLYDKMKKSWQEKDRGNVIVLREQAVRLLSRYPVRTESLYEWYGVAQVFQRTLTAAETAPRDAADMEDKLFFSVEEFEPLMRKLKESFACMEKTRQIIVTANLRLVVSIVRPFRRDSLQTGDLIQEGNLGLIKAMDRFDYRMGHKFSTYATWWIKQSIARSISSQLRIIRLPAHMLAAVARIRRAERNFIQETGCDPTADDLAKILEMPRERVNAIRKMAEQSISLQAPISENPDAPLLEQLICEEDEDENEENPLHNLAYKLLKTRLAQELENLSEREQQILKLRFGLAGKPAMTLVDLGTYFGLTRERVRQLEIRALQKLRNSKLSDDMSDYFS